jgi:hypothetical protein
VALLETYPELCRFTERLDLGSTSSSDNLPSNSPDQLYQQRLSQQLSKSFEAGHLDIRSKSSSDYILARPADTLSEVTFRELCHWAVRYKNNSSSSYLQSNSLTEQILCRATLPAVILLETSPKLCLCHRPGSNSISAHHADCFYQEQRRERQSCSRKRIYSKRLELST